MKIMMEPKGWMQSMHPFNGHLRYCGCDMPLSMTVRSSSFRLFKDEYLFVEWDQYIGS